jgi:hypothetical protein
LGRQHIADKGFLTFAVGEQYLRAARAQAMTVKLTQSTKNFAVVVDVTASKAITEDDTDMFDKIIVVDHVGQGWDMSREWMAFQFSPWRNTFKTDADMLFTASIDHWWTALQHRDVCVSRSVRDFRGDVITSRYHRRLFDANHLPDAYSAMTFFRYSKGAADFFATVRKISEDWEWFAKDLLVKNDDLRPRTDEMYAIASMIIGPELTMSHSDDLPTFVHMKERLNGLGEVQSWHEQIPSYWNGGKLFIGNVAQMLPFHYHQKGALTDELYASIQRDYRKLFQSP